MQNQADPTFYRSPGEAMAAPPERLAYVAAYDPAGKAKDAMAVLDCRPVLGHLRPGGRLERAADGRERAAPLRLERLLQRPVPPGPRRPRPAAGAPLPDRARHPLLADLCARHQGRPPPPPGGPDHRGRRAGRQGRLLPPPHPALWAGRDLHVGPGRGQRQRRPRRGRPARPRQLRRRRRLGTGPRRAVLRLRRVVAPGLRHRHHLGMGHPVDVRGRPQPRGPARPPLRPPPQLLVHVRAHPHPAHRPGRRPPDGAGAPPGPRPGQGLGVRRGGHQRRGPVGVGLLVVPRRGALGGPQGHHHPRRAGRPRPAPPRPQALRGRAPPDQRHRPVGGRPLAVRVVLGHRRAQAVRRQRPLQPGRDRLGPPRRHRRPPAPPLGTRPAPFRRPPDGRDQPRRPPGLCHQLAVRRLGRHLLPRRRRRLAGQARRQPHHAAAWPPTRGSSPTATTSAACGSTRPASKAATPPATPTATPARPDMHPLAHHAGEQALAPLLLLAGGGFTMVVAIGRAGLADARKRLARKLGRGAS